MRSIPQARGLRSDPFKLQPKAPVMRRWSTWSLIIAAMITAPFWLPYAVSDLAMILLRIAFVLSFT